MNGVLHSEHVISRSGIAVSPRGEKRTFTLLLFGALALRFFQPLVVGRKHCILKRYAEKLASRRVSWSECTPAPVRIQIFYLVLTQKSVANLLHNHLCCGVWAT